MCGINGIVRFSENVLEEEIKKMNDTIRHRGPDDEGVCIFNTENYSIGLGHVRLAILDLSEKGHQPMGYNIENDKIIYRDDELYKADIIIVYNGEVYNYLELKERYNLETETGTDTEIILKLYNKLGYDCVKEFNGMWAFCIYDKRKNILFCSRDRLGVKPFYYYWDENEFVFSSELKGILSVKKINKKENINKEAVELYFALGFIPSPYCIYKNTFKLEARQNLIFDLNKKEIKKYYYWELPKYNPIYDKEKLIEEGKKLLYDAVKIRMRSDVPVGAFLSGGLDSSTVVGVMREFTDLKKLHTFSIGFEGKYDETPYIKIVVDYFKTNHHHYYFKEEDFEKLIDKYSWIYDEPFGDYSGFPTYKVSEMAKQFVTVVLSGDGGDEIFGGYLNHVNGYRMDFIRKLPKILRILGSKLPVKKNLNGIVNLYLLKEAFRLSLINPEKFYAESIKEEAIRPEIYKKWTTEKMKYCLIKGDNKLGESMRIFDLLYNTLPDNFLVKVDRSSMANALEVRSPFLDYRFAEFSQKIPTEWKIDLFKTKKLMREIIKDILPEEIVNRGKQGFTPPLADWILKEKYLNEIFEKVEILKEIDYELYRFFKEKVFKNKEQSLYRNYLIRLFLFIKWWERWIDMVKLSK
ncbi:Asparagine synthetase (glutamine-hydrolyzing) [Methanocaldococcus lauensis]|uniref:Putative asparagine synthetase [glutamine-hydrolyzing] n=1 Tax=Methanocaldococcus lauensis TaxID=2546128 RepID=A0A8D6PTP5_9EURY|nr:asparagine synthase (glutamine-hydrolyzing) [Methanocaldococcus lauensis]CAB3290091.1 Asparagine synthetase (glutamine-hydrolyzing) [Methanocaldococcus lauensis]